LRLSHNLLLGCPIHTDYIFDAINYTGPVYKKYFDLIKSKTNAKIFYHTCGNVVDLLDDLIEIGVDITP